MLTMKKINWRYTFGELLIVITGITIAFWLNNWKESREEEILAEEYLANLRTDLQRDIDTLAYSIVELKRSKEFVKRYINGIMNPELRNDSISQKIYKLAQTEIFTEHNATFSTLINSGDIKLIKNLELRTAIVDQYNMYKDLHLKEEIHLNYLTDYLGPFMIKNYYYAKGMQTEIDVWQDRELINLIFSS